MSASMLRMDGVSRLHGQGPQAVRALGPVDLEIEAGEFVAIMGPSGSGKSTLLALAGALDRPSEGTVRVQGEDLASLDKRSLAAVRRRVIGFVFQDFNLLPGLSAAENVALPLELDGMVPRKAQARAAEALALVELEGLASRFPDDLSGGEKQRVAIARAFVGPRQMLLADEPTGALDTLTGELVMRLMRKQCDRGRTVVLVTHDPCHAAWADRVLYLRDGQIADGLEPGVTQAPGIASPFGS